MARKRGRPDCLLSTRSQSTRRKENGSVEISVRFASCFISIMSVQQEEESNGSSGGIDWNDISCLYIWQVIRVSIDRRSAMRRRVKWFALAVATTVPTC